MNKGIFEMELRKILLRFDQNSKVVYYLSQEN